MAEKMVSQSSSIEESSEVAAELDDALNELGMLSSGQQESKLIRTRSEFIKDKWSVSGRRGYPLRYPLRREKEREISWCSGTSSTSSGSSGSGSRRSSSTSSSSSGSFCSSIGGGGSTRSYSRSSLISSYSIAETPTGNAPIGGPFGTTTTTSSSSNSSLCSSIDLMDQPMTGVSSFKSIDYPKVLRRIHHSSYKPYNLGIKPSRRFSLQLGIHREERGGVCSSFAPPSSSSFSDNLNLKSGLLSDSEASSGSGTGTPPPPHHCHGHRPHSQQQPISFQGLILDPIGFNARLKSPFKETKSNPTSPTSEFMSDEFRTSDFRPSEQFRTCDFSTSKVGTSGSVSSEHTSIKPFPFDHPASGSVGTFGGRGFDTFAGGAVDTSAVVSSRNRCRDPGTNSGIIGVPCDLNVTCCYTGTPLMMNRSKSLDDLSYALLLQDNSSSCSSDAFSIQTCAASGVGGYQSITSGQSISGQGQGLTSTSTRQQFEHLISVNEVDSLTSGLTNYQQVQSSTQQQRLLASSLSSSNLGPNSSLGTGSSIGTNTSSGTNTSLVNQQSVICNSNLLQPVNSNQIPVTSSSCDNLLFESVLQRIGRLEM